MNQLYRIAKKDRFTIENVTRFLKPSNIEIFNISGAQAWETVNEQINGIFELDLTNLSQSEYIFKTKER